MISRLRIIFVTVKESQNLPLLAAILGPIGSSLGPIAILSLRKQIRRKLNRRGKLLMKAHLQISKTNLPHPLDNSISESRPKFKITVVSNTRKRNISPSQ